jgi:cephalosporin hydroxylase
MGNRMRSKQDFEARKRTFIGKMAANHSLQELSRRWFVASSKLEYSYHFTWLGRPVIQFPQDIVALQEIIWRIKPDLIIETGIAHGGSLIFYASMLELIAENGQVLGIDLDIRGHNRVEIERHPMAKRITMIEGSSVDEQVAARVWNFARDKKRTLVVLDSNHTHPHVLKEMQLYSPLVRRGSYLVVLDTIIDRMAEEFSKNRPWGKANNPRTAVRKFMKSDNRFVIDTELENKLLITVAPDGYLRCIKD